MVSRYSRVFGARQLLFRRRAPGALKDTQSLRSESAAAAAVASAATASVASVPPPWRSSASVTLFTPLLRTRQSGVPAGVLPTVSSHAPDVGDEGRTGGDDGGGPAEEMISIHKSKKREDLTSGTAEQQAARHYNIEG